MKRSLGAVCFVLFCFIGSVGFSQVSGAVSEALKKGGNFEKEKKFDEALGVYTSVLEKEPNEELYKRAGSLFGKLRKYEEGIAFLGKGLEAFPGNTSLLNLYGFLKFKEGDKAGAREQWKLVLAKDANNSFAKEWMSKTEGSTAKAPSPSPSSDLSGDNAPMSAGLDPEPVGDLDAQKKLAAQLYGEMVDLDIQELDKFSDLHRQVIKKCPQTKRAEESCWRLSNLYLIGRDVPENEKAAELLEHLLKTFPDSEFGASAKTRLIPIYQDLKNYRRVAELYGEMFKNKDQLPDGKFCACALEYGEALLAIGQKDDARVLFEEVVQRGGKANNEIAVQVAEDFLRTL